MADLLLGYDPRIDTAPDFAEQAQQSVYDVPANVTPAVTGNAHPNHMHAGGLVMSNPTYAGSIYPVGE